ncbi:hypothetical protein O6H91_09G034100 [Diphasiastrum complanatum]|uniref:Uncharacterized protein n=2 Tax=Diphasiastrum complanatum TaxID=34168 RepID=A0ACC2CMW0_DIPCM|nr:hypothetical protein O6H91_09G034100 [Diphasiastrum complanatum]
MELQIPVATIAVALLVALQVNQIWASSADGSAPIYKNPHYSVEARVKDLLARMTLEEKIGQMTQIERENASTAVVQKYLIGSVLSGGGSVPAPQASVGLWQSTVSSFQNGALATRLGIPIIYGIDAVHGHNNVYGATIFPHNVGLGATSRDPDLVRRIGEATALEVRATGIPYVFAPCIAVCRDPRWGRCYESYSEDPILVKSLTDVILGLQGTPPAEHKAGQPFVKDGSHVAACAKHYVGDGGTQNGINEGNTVISYRDLKRIHLAPYIDALAKGVSTVMVSYSSFNGEKMHANHFLITRMLKTHLKFKGFVISDWQGIDKISTPPFSNYTYSVLTSINAGIDMVMVPYDYVNFINNLTTLVKTGYIQQNRIDDAVKRILGVKFTAGLFDLPFSNSVPGSVLGEASHRSLAREAVRKSLVLLKNGKDLHSPLLPLSKTAPKILVAGSHANNLGYQAGGWTITWQGGSGNTTIGTTIFQAITGTVSASTQVVYEESPDVNFAKGGGFSYAIVVVGEPPYAETFGDSTNLTITSQGVQTIENVCSTVKCVVVIISGRPVVVEPYLPIIDALVAAWLPGTEGQGVTDVIFGDYNFEGKLPRTWFRTVEQLPLNVGDKHYDPLFPYGFGLRTGVSRRLTTAKFTRSSSFH